MKRIVGLALGMLFSAAALAAESGVSIKDAWVREAPPTARALAGYMVVENGGAEQRVLTGVSAEGFGGAMLHRTVTENGMAKMVHQQAIVIPAGESVIFRPKGYHIMLMKPERVLKVGDEVAITLEFKNGETRRVTFEVRRGKGMAMDHGNMK